ncbi:MAG: hypothetical protein KY476_06760, partial [Planctomycetes bacterium]|nr:hypothetical protein [Planctomycetota bacterium]
MKRSRRQFVSAAPSSDRRGTVLVVVLGLLGLLALIGFTTYTFSTQEQASAEYFLLGRKAEANAGLPPDVLFDHAMRQVILGPRIDELNSALWGGRHSLLANAYGRDIHPFAGVGVNLVSTGDGRFFIDQNHNGIADDGPSMANPTEPDNRHLLFFNDSPAAAYEDRNFNGQLDAGEDNAVIPPLGTAMNPFPGVWPDYTRYPAPDADYTAPDLNAAFLGYNGFGLTIRRQPVRTIIPSYHRPALMRVIDSADSEVRMPVGEDLNGNQRLDPGEDTNNNGVLDDWYLNPALARRMLRAHPSHAYIGVHPADNSTPAAVGPRYIVTQAQADALGANGPFPFGFDLPNEGPPNGAYGEQGVWSLGPWRANTPYYDGQWVVANRLQESQPGAGDHRYGGFVYRATLPANTPPLVAGGRPARTSSGSEPFWPNQPGGTVNENGITWEAHPTMTANYEYDADPDGDGIREAVLLDLDFPVQQKSDGRFFIPMYAITIYDADGLMNLLAHGNVEGEVNPRDPNRPFGVNQYLSRSNQAVTPSEVNPQWALNAVPAIVDTDPFAGDVAVILNPSLTPNQMVAQSIAQTLDQQSLFYGHQPTTNTAGAAWAPWVEMSNMEWFFANVGKPQLQGSTIVDVTPGRYGEANPNDTLNPMTEHQYTFGPAVTRMLSGQPVSRFDFPGPGTSIAMRDLFLTLNPGAPPALVPNPDDFIPGTNRRNRSWGTVEDNLSDRFRHPLDYRGLGSRVDTNSIGRQFALVSQNPVHWVQYTDHPITAAYSAFSVTNLMTLSRADWPAGAPPGGGDLSYRITEPLLDEVWEMDVFHDEANFDIDSIFGMSDAAALALSSADIENLGLNPRVLRLFDFNFRRNVRANEIRKRFTTISQDVKTFGTRIDASQVAPGVAVIGPNNPRPWEWQNDVPPRRPAFPPRPAMNDPLREELRKLLTVEVGVQNPLPGQLQVQRQRRLSINHVLDYARNPNTGAIVPDPLSGQPTLESRELTAHPDDPGDAPIPSALPPYTPNSWGPAAQEAWARRDRQVLARDIYTLLYLSVAAGRTGEHPPPTAVDR